VPNVIKQNKPSIALQLLSTLVNPLFLQKGHLISVVVDLRVFLSSSISLALTELSELVIGDCWLFGNVICWF